LLFIVVFSLYFASLTLDLPEKTSSLVAIITKIAFFIQVALWGSGLISFWADRQVAGSVEKQDEATATSVNVLEYVAKVVMWAVILILILDNLPGVEVNSLITSLGIGGVAVALAVQSILGDLFASLSILLDKPFVIGDALKIGDFVGTVERIGLSTTRIRSLDGEELIFANSDLTKSRISNYGTMTRRRTTFTLGIKGDTPYEKLATIPEMVEAIICAHENTSFERCHFRSYGDFALNFEVVYFVEDSNFKLALDIQQAINMAIYQQFEAAGIEFAFPTQTIILEQ
jgi:small-conductance mechanosensitive channel